MPDEVLNVISAVAPASTVLGMGVTVALLIYKGVLWTKPSVDRLIASHEAAMKALIERYEQHIKRTFEAVDGRAADAREREKEWRETAMKALDNNDKMADQLDAVLEGQATLAALLSSARNSAHGGRDDRG